MVRHLSRSLLMLLTLFSPLLSQAGVGLTLQGRILKPDGQPVDKPNVQFKVQIRSGGNEDCLLYQETQSYDMRGTNGLFSLTIGNGVRVNSTIDGGYSMDRIFANRGTLNLSATSPAACMIGTNFVPSIAQNRRLVYFFNDGSGWQTVPSIVINWVPQALESLQVGGFQSSQLLRVSDASGNPSSAPNLTVVQAAELMNLLTGATTQYVKPGSATFTAAPQYSGAVSGANDLTNKAYVDSALASAVSSGLPDVGVAGTYTKVTTDAKGRVTSGATLSESDLPTISTAGKVVGSAIISGTIGGSTSLNTSGHIVTSGTVSGNTVSGNSLRLYNGTTNYISLSSPTLSGIVSFVLPASDGTSGQVLKTDGSGNLSWITPAPTSDGTKLPLAGGTMTGAIAMGGHPLTQVGNLELSTNKYLGFGQYTLDPDTTGWGATEKGRTWFNSTSNEMKYWDGSLIRSLGVAGNGISSFNGSSQTAQTFAIPGTSGLAPGWSTNSATGVHTLNIPMASTASVTAGLISKAEYDLFSAKLGTATALSGDVTGTYNTTTVTKIQGKAVAPVAYSAGQTLKYDGTNWVNSTLSFSDLSGKPTTLSGYGITDAVSKTLDDGKILVGNSSNLANAVTISGDATLSNTGTLTLQTVPISKGGTGLTSFGVNKVVTTSGTGALQSTSCSQYQVISFDTSGNWYCANVNALSGSFINGGNSFAGDATLGTSDNYKLSLKANNTVAISVDTAGQVGVGSAATTPAAPLDVAGTIRSRVHNNGSGTTFNWNSGNLQYTTTPCAGSNWTMNNVLDGGSYTMIVKASGAHTGSCLFTGSGVTTWHFQPANATPSGSSHVVYTFLRAGTDVYVSWIEGF